MVAVMAGEAAGASRPPHPLASQVVIVVIAEELARMELLGHRGDLLGPLVTQRHLHQIGREHAAPQSAAAIDWRERILLSRLRGKNIHPPPPGPPPGRPGGAAPAKTASTGAFARRCARAHPPRPTPTHPPLRTGRPPP